MYSEINNIGIKIQDSNYKLRMDALHTKKGEIHKYLSSWPGDKKLTKTEVVNVVCYFLEKVNDNFSNQLNDYLYDEARVLEAALISHNSDGDDD